MKRGITDDPRRLAHVRAIDRRPGQTGRQGDRHERQGSERTATRRIVADGNGRHRDFGRAIPLVLTSSSTARSPRSGAGAPRRTATTIVEEAPLSDCAATGATGRLSTRTAPQATATAPRT